MPAVTARKRDAADVAALVLRDSLHRDTPNVLAMFRRVTDAIQRSDGDAFAGELTQDALAWNDGHRVTGATSVTALVMGHRALAPGQQMEFGEPRVAFVGAEAWVRLDWAWSVWAGGAICRLVRQDSAWRIAAVDPTGERLTAPVEEFDPRLAAEELDCIASVVRQLGASLRAAGARAFISGSGGDLPILDADGGQLAPGIAERHLDELTEHMHPAGASVAACLPSGRALVIVPRDGADFTLHIERAGRWRLSAITRADRHQADSNRIDARDRNDAHTEA